MAKSVRPLTLRVGLGPTGSSLVRDSYCAGALSKFFGHIAMQYHSICAAELCEWTFELKGRRAMSKISLCIIGYYCRSMLRQQER